MRVIIGRKKTYTKISNSFKNAITSLEEVHTKEAKYIAMRLNRLERMMTHCLSLGKKNQDLIVLGSRSTVDTLINVINLIVLGNEYATYLDKESEFRNLQSSRDYLKGYIADQDVNTRKKFLGKFEEGILNKFEQIEIKPSTLRSDSSKILHDNQCSYNVKPTSKNIEYVDNIIFFLSTQIFSGLNAKYGVKPKKHMIKLEKKSREKMNEYKLFKKSDMKKLAKILAE